MDLLNHVIIMFDMLRNDHVVFYSNCTICTHSSKANMGLGLLMKTINPRYSLLLTSREREDHSLRTDREKS
jgi:hypothetical protein